MRTAIHWFRKDLRLTDNTALNHAVASAEQVVPVFVRSTWTARHQWTGAARQEFLAGCLQSLAENIATAGGRLIFRAGRADEELVRLVKESGATVLTFNRDPDPFGREMEERVTKAVRALGVEVVSCKDAVMHEAGEALTKDGRPYRVFTPYSRNWLALPKPPVGPRVKSLRTPATLVSEPVPAVADWGLAPSGVSFVAPGERAARERMKSFVSTLAVRYATDRDLPAGRTTSRLSQDLRLGLISIRQLVGHVSAFPKYVAELAWREFYMAILTHWPEVLEHEFDPQWRGLPWEYDEGKFKAWREGRTGFPIVDAGMRELNETGFMHNRVRMIAAMFLTKDLHLDWRLGEQYFMQRLVDGEIASNNGGWQWSAGTGADAAPYFRIQNPWSQTARYDPDGAYIRRWVPELKNTPARDLATDPGPLLSLASGYPRPIVDHATERLKTLAIFKAHKERMTG